MHNNNFFYRGGNSIVVVLGVIQFGFWVFLFVIGLYVVYYFDFHLVLSLVIFIREISKIHNTYLYGVDFSIVVVLGVVRTKFVWAFGFFY